MTDFEKAVIAVRELYEEQPVGGILHIVTDDGNTEDHHMEWVGQFIDDANEHWGRCMTSVERACYEALLTLSEDDRDAVLREVEKT